MTKTILFIYGTLKRGQRNHHYLAGQEFLGEATTMPLYRVYHLGAHPGMVLDAENGVDVKGELWSVDDGTLARLDEFEGIEGGWFIRADVAVRDCFETVQAYFFNQKIPPEAPSGPEWPLLT